MVGRVDFLDLPHSGPGTPPGSASPLKPVKHFLVYLVVFYLTIKSDTVSTVFPSISHEVIGPEIWYIDRKFKV